MHVYSSRSYVQSGPPRQSIEDYCHGERSTLCNTSKEPVCPRVELILNIIIIFIILLIIFLGFIKSKPC